MGRFAEMVARHRDRARKTTDKAIEAVEVVGAAGAMGYANHRFGAGEIKLGTSKDGTGGVPLDGSLFLIGHLAAFSGKAGKYASHLHNLANGAGAGFAYRTGADFGDKAASGAGSGSTSGQLVGADGYAQLGPYFQQWGPSVGFPQHLHAPGQYVGRR
jgi:hypothetical protein